MTVQPWELVHQYQSGITGHAGVLYNNRAVALGGISNGVETSMVIATPNGINLDNIIQNPPGFSPRAGHAACVFDERVYLSGGIDGQTAYNDIIVSADLKSWETLFSAPSGFYGHRMVAFGNQRVKLVVLGGYAPDSGDYLDMVAMSSDGRSWDQIAPIGSMWSARMGFGALVYKNRLWIFGGQGATGNLDLCFNDVWYTEDLIHWHRALEHAPWGKRSDFGYCIWDERMWIIAGKDYVGRMNITKDDVWFSRDGVTWEKSFDFPTHLRYTYAAPLDNKIHVFGGTGNEQNIYKMNIG